MGSFVETQKSQPHAVCIPFPAQGHINPMLKLAKLLHYKGFHITFVNTEYNQRRLLKSLGPDALKGLHSFRFESIPDGLPPSDSDSTQDVQSLCDSTSKNCLAPFRQLLCKLNSSADVPRVSCIVSDGIMSFTLEAAKELCIPDVLFWTNGACGVMGYLHYRKLIDKGLVPLKDASYLTNGYLDKEIDWIPGMEGIRLKDIPTFVRTTDPNDIVLNFAISEVGKIPKASALILNTFYALEKDILDALSSIVPAVYSISPLHLALDQIQEPDASLQSIGSNLWKEESGCIEWLDTKKPNSVIYVNFGSVTVISPQQLVEFAFGLVNSKQAFLWILRPDLVMSETTVLPAEFVAETKDRGLLSSWCPQERVLEHPSIGGFLTHCGWNSTMESICGGVPMLCWPFFAEQQTNCWYCCNRLGVGMEIDSNVKRNQIESQVRELMIGEKGREMKKKALEWKKLAMESISPPYGSSYQNFEKLVSNVLMSPMSPLSE